VEKSIEVSDAREMPKKLKSQLDEFEKIREAVAASVEAAGRLLPDLKKQKERLEGEIDEKKEKLREIDEMELELGKKKLELEDILERKQKQVSDIDHQIGFISHVLRS